MVGGREHPCESLAASQGQEHNEAEMGCCFFPFLLQLKYPSFKEREVSPSYFPILKLPSKSSHQKRGQDRTQRGKQTLIKWHLFTSKLKQESDKTACAQGQAQALFHFHVVEAQESSAFLCPHSSCLSARARRLKILVCCGNTEMECVSLWKKFYDNSTEQ